MIIIFIKYNQVKDTLLSSYRLYNALCTGEHGTDYGKVLGVEEALFPHVLDDISGLLLRCCLRINWVDAGCKQTDRTTQSKS